jgi:hypothetical protein
MPLIRHLLTNHFKTIPVYKICTLMAMAKRPKRSFFQKPASAVISHQLFIYVIADKIIPVPMSPYIPLIGVDCCQILFYKQVSVEKKSSEIDIQDSPYRTGFPTSIRAGV